MPKKVEIYDLPKSLFFAISIKILNVYNLWSKFNKTQKSFNFILVTIFYFNIE